MSFVDFAKETELQGSRIARRFDSGRNIVSKTAVEASSKEQLSNIKWLLSLPSMAPLAIGRKLSLVNAKYRHSIRRVEERFRSPEVTG